MRQTNFHLTAFVCLLLLVCQLSGNSQSIDTIQKVVSALKTDQPIVIDGLLTEAAWKQKKAASSFTQLFPQVGEASRMNTDVTVLYDNSGIYVGAVLYDENPDSILREISERDQFGNVDVFALVIDTYQDGQNGFLYAVGASGGQFDAKIAAQGNNNNTEFTSGEDRSWDAVWDSKISFTKEGWVVEMKIPYSAIRFPKQGKQRWGINFLRTLQRYNERSAWSFVDPTKQGFLNQGGVLEGIENIKAPLRLQANPFLAVYGTKYHDVQNNPVNAFGRSINGGMDIKVGLSDAFTLDMTLIPDFGEAISDNQVLNLSPFEVRFDENRPFFTEGVELFNKGGLFYSRRVGGRPMHYWNVDDQLQEGETIVENPQNTQLYNATKISGRTNKGLGVGLFNATAAETHATIQNSLGENRTYETSPLTNFNVLVLDQNLKNNSSATLINTTVIRSGQDYDANVTGGQFNLRNKKNSYSIAGSGVLTQQYHTDQTNLGHAYGLELNKTSGNWTWGLSHNAESNTYNPNDLGFLYSNNEISTNLWTNLEQYKPWWKFNRMGVGLWMGHSQLYKPRAFTEFGINPWAWAQTKSFWNLNVWGYWRPTTGRDYFEPRTEGRYWEIPSVKNMGFWVGTDSRKKFRMSLNMNRRFIDYPGRSAWNIGTEPRMRFSDKFNVSLGVFYSDEKNDVGFVNNQTTETLDPVTQNPILREAIIFGSRNLVNVENSLRANYNFTQNTTLSLRIRHNWTRVNYQQYHELAENGTLLDTDYNQSHDGNFNAFNVDMIFRWRFAPGSDLFVIWKNAALEYTDFANVSYMENFEQFGSIPVSNSLSLKAIYFLDYARLTGK